MLDWLFEAIIGWVGKTVTKLMDAVSGLFLSALGTDMLAMEEYFPFVGKAFTIMQYFAWALLFLITVWQLFRCFSGPLGESENPFTLLLRGGFFAVLIGFAKPIFMYVLEIAKAPYSALMDLPMSGEDFTFAGVESVLKNGLVNIVSSMAVVGTLLIIILMIALGWNYFKLLLEVVERYVVVGVLCYTSPLAYSMGASKATSQVFKSWCRMVGSQLLLLVMNVWFLRGFHSSIGYYVTNGGALSNGQGSIFLWLFCALAFLKTAQKFDSYLASIGLNVAQTGSGMGTELLMAARVITGMGGGVRGASSMFRGTGGGTASAGTAPGFGAGFASKFKGNSFVRDSVVQGGTRMGAGGSIGFVGRIFGGMAARNGATLTGESISSVAAKAPNISGTIGGDIANRSLSNYIPRMAGHKLTGTEITGGRIRTSVVGSDGKQTSLEMFATSQYEKPNASHAVVTASDGSLWYQMASGSGKGVFYDAPVFQGSAEESAQVASQFPSAPDGTVLRTVGTGEIEATTPNGTSVWYNSAYFQRPDAPHTAMDAENGVSWYAMKPNAEIPNFESGDAATAYNEAAFREFMPGFARPITTVDAHEASEGYFDVRHEDGSGTRFYDATMYVSPRGGFQVYEDSHGSQWYAIRGEAAVDRKPIFEDGKPVYNGENIRTVSVETIRYRNTPVRFAGPEMRTEEPIRTPARKR